ncbi:hypothetical protein [Azospirillum sp. SYSU D00513]|uniref:hypothetical protein n=1 Tax=Azospirillum sp. SYSU D00513 TaxID=2812561 RepID=UPI001A964913|nr:hypothetical protein [Azospirillum sp. SYSU D00513]
MSRTQINTHTELEPLDDDEVIEVFSDGYLEGAGSTSMPEVNITFCNRAYANKWLKNLKRQNPSHFSVLQAIIEEIQKKDGGDIQKGDLLHANPDIVQYINENRFDIIPSRGQMLMHNGNGIRHAKFAPSKSVAVIWEKIGNTIYVTFDDHAPIRYYRAIRHLREIKLGKRAFPKKPRSTGRFLRKLKAYWRLKHSKDLKGINLKRLYIE